MLEWGTAVMSLQLTGKVTGDLVSDDTIPDPKRPCGPGRISGSWEPLLNRDLLE